MNDTMTCSYVIFIVLMDGRVVGRLSNIPLLYLSFLFFLPLKFVFLESMNLGYLFNLFVQSCVQPATVFFFRYCSCSALLLFELFGWVIFKTWLQDACFFSPFFFLSLQLKRQITKCITVSVEYIKNVQNKHYQWTAFFWTGLVRCQSYFSWKMLKRKSGSGCTL
jgi:hypothetical protein